MSDSANGSPEIDPDEAGRREFSKARRGFEPNEVRAHLLALSAELKRVKGELSTASAKADRLEKDLSDKDSLDPATVTKVLGEETARVLESARGAAEEIRARAESSSAELLEETQKSSKALKDEAEEIRSRAAKESDELTAAARMESQQLLEEARSIASKTKAEAEEAAKKLREEASKVLEERTSEAHKQAEIIREDAHALKRDAEEYSEGLRSEAISEVAQLKEKAAAEAAAEAEAVVEGARERGREMLSEAKEARERMLRDLAEKRTVARRQLEAMRAGRERLLESFSSARTALESVTEDLVDSLPAAREAANEAAESIDEDLDSAVAELDSEIGSADESIEEFEQLVGADSSEPEAASESITPEPVVSTSTDSADSESTEEDDSVEQAKQAEGEQVGEDAEPEESSAATEPDPIEAPTGDAEDSETPAKNLDSVSELEPEGESAPEETKSHLRLIANDHDDHDEDDEDADDDDLMDDEFVDLDDDDFEDTYASGSSAAKLGAPVAPVDDLFARIRADATEPSESGSKPPGSGAVVIDLIKGDNKTVTIESSDSSSDEDSAGEPEVEGAPSSVDQGLLDLRDELIERHTSEMIRRVKRWLSDQENHLLDRARRDKKARSSEVLLAELDDGTDLEVVLESYLVELLDASASYLESNSISPRSMNNSDVLSKMLDLRFQTLVEPLRTRIGNAVDDTPDDSRDGVELVAKLRGVFREWRNDHVNGATADVATTTFNSGVLASAPESMEFRWIVDFGGLPCPDGNDNNLAGDVEAGVEFPTGDVCPAAHPGCRCLLAPTNR